MKSTLSYLFTAVNLLISTAVFSQYTEVINSNRPGASASAFSVGTNVVQFELGPTYLREEHDLLDFEATGFTIDFAARYGFLFEELEINVDGSFRSDTFTDNRTLTPTETNRNNFNSLTLNVKYLVYDPYKNAEEEKPNLYSYHANRKFKWKSLIPAVAVQAGINFDTSDNPFTAPTVDGISPRVLVATQNNFAGGWVFVTNFLLNRIGNEFSDFQYLLTLTYSLNTRWVAFIETQGIDSDFNSDNLFRFGGAYLLGKNFQLDTAVTFNTKDTPSVFNVTLGASYRLDFHKDKELLPTNQ